jgi:hypothetical protein
MTGDLSQGTCHGQSRFLEDAPSWLTCTPNEGSPKYERAAMRWLARYLMDGSPRLEHFAELVTDLATRDH